MVQICLLSKTPHPWALEEFYPRGAILDFSRGSQINFFMGGGKSGENSLYPVKTKKTSFFCKKFRRKTSHFKI